MLGKKIKPYEFMVYPTLQTNWIKGKGILLFLGLFFVEFGAGIFLAASIFNSLWGQTAGWLISGILGGGCHFLFLGHPLRIYKAVKRPRKSWISRGLLIISLFQLFGFIHLVLAFYLASPTWLLFIANIMAVVTILYGGYEIADIKAIPTWNSSFLPYQMLGRSFFIGLAIVMIVNILFGLDTAGDNLEYWLLITLFINVCLFALSLTSIGFEEGKEMLSLVMMAKGSLRWIFWPWVIAGGMTTPILLAVYGLAFGYSGIRPCIFLVAVILQTIADPVLRYCLIRSGYYAGLFPGKPNDFR